MLGAEEAHPAGRRVERHHAHALLEAAYAVADFFDDTCQFMPKQRGRNNHARMVAALVDLQVGAAGQRHLDLDQDLAFAHARNRDLFDLDVLFAIEDRRRHFSVHFEFPSQALPG